MSIFVHGSIYIQVACQKNIVIEFSYVKFINSFVYNILSINVCSIPVTTWKKNWILYTLHFIYEVLPKISENLLVITWIPTLSPNFHRHLRSSHLGLVYNDPSDFAIFGSTHWSLPALACLVPVAILLGSLQWMQSPALSSGFSF